MLSGRVCGVVRRGGWMVGGWWLGPWEFVFVMYVCCWVFVNSSPQKTEGLRYQFEIASTIL